MSKNIDGVAYFFNNPREIGDLLKLHISGQRSSYFIEKIIELSKCDYTNFITDFCVNRRFIEENRNLCYIDSADIWHCLLVRQFKKTNGILVQSDGYEYAKNATYYYDHLNKKCG